MSTNYYVGVDLGAANTRVAWVSSDRPDFLGGFDMESMVKYRHKRRSYENPYELWEPRRWLGNKAVMSVGGGNLAPVQCIADLLDRVFSKLFERLAHSHRDHVNWHVLFARPHQLSSTAWIEFTRACRTTEARLATRWPHYSISFSETGVHEVDAIALDYVMRVKANASPLVFIDLGCEKTLLGVIKTEVNGGQIRIRPLVVDCDGQFGAAAWDAKVAQHWSNMIEDPETNDRRDFDRQFQKSRERLARDAASTGGLDLWLGISPETRPHDQVRVRLSEYQRWSQQLEHRLIKNINDIFKKYRRQHGENLQRCYLVPAGGGLMMPSLMEIVKHVVGNHTEFGCDPEYSTPRLAHIAKGACFMCAIRKGVTLRHTRSGATFDSVVIDDLATGSNIAQADRSGGDVDPPPRKTSTHLGIPPSPHLQRAEDCSRGDGEAVREIGGDG